MIIFTKLIFVAVIITFLSIKLLRPFAIKINLVDLPDNRKRHKGSVPLIGGIAMFIGIAIGIFSSSINLSDLIYFIFPAFILLIIGVYDDLSNLPVAFRLLFQLIISLIMIILGGNSIESLGSILFGYGEIFLGSLSLLVSVLAVITAINAVNMADGIHGLAGGNSLVSFLAISYLSINSNSYETVIVCLLFCAVLATFLVFNLCLGISQKNRIFMGDAGSTLIGFTIVWALLVFTQGQDKVFAPVIALWLFAFPLYEFFYTFLRRLSSGLSPLKADSFHTHHLFLKLGFDEKKTLTIMISGSVFMALIGVLGESYDISDHIMFLGFIIIFIFYSGAGTLASKKIQSSGKN